MLKTSYVKSSTTFKKRTTHCLPDRVFLPPLSGKIGVSHLAICLKGEKPDTWRNFLPWLRFQKNAVGPSGNPLLPGRIFVRHKRNAQRNRYCKTPIKSPSRYYKRLQSWLIHINLLSFFCFETLEGFLLVFVARFKNFTQDPIVRISEPKQGNRI